MKIADDMIDDAKTKLQKTLESNSVNKNLVHQVLSKIKIWTESERNFNGKHALFAAKNLTMIKPALLLDRNILY